MCRHCQQRHEGEVIWCRHCLQLFRGRLFLRCLGLIELLTVGSTADCREEEHDSLHIHSQIPLSSGNIAKQTTVLCNNRAPDQSVKASLLVLVGNIPCSMQLCWLCQYEASRCLISSCLFYCRSVMPSSSLMHVTIYVTL